MKPTIPHWRILHAVRDCDAMLPETLAEVARIPLKDVVTLTTQMMDPEFSDLGAWLYLDQHRFHLAGVSRDGECSTGGHAAIEEAATNERIMFRIQPWKDEVLTGMRADGKQSTIGAHATDDTEAQPLAVLQTVSSGPGQREAWEDKYVRLVRERERDLKEESELVRRCSAKGCFAPLETESPWCKSCARKKMRACRKKGK